MRTVILKVTHICNLACKYCCVGDTIDNDVMREDTLKAVFSKLAEDSPESNIIWHGGEPLTVGLEYYKEVVKLQKMFSPHTFHNSIQTNGTLLNEESLQFFKANNFSLGFSIDGNKISHEMNRPYKNGSSSFDDTYKWFLRARELGMNVGAICVLNANTAKYIDEIYHFAKCNHIAFKFNAQYPAGRASVNIDLGLDNKQIADVYIRLFDLWYDDTPDERANIRMFDVFIEGIAASLNGDTSGHGYDCAYCNRCQNNFIGISPKGDIYPCGKFVGESQYIYGNINEDKSLKSILDNEIRKSFITRHENGIEECKNCKYYNICASGCPYNAVLFNNDLMSKNPMCSSILPVFRHIEERVKERTRLQDIYIIPTDDKHDNFLIYSPLRGNCFIADKIAAEQVRSYLNSKGAKKCLNEKLQEYLEKWESTIPIPPKSYDVFSPNHVVLLLTHKCNLSCTYCFARNARANMTMQKDSLKCAIDFVLNTVPNKWKTFSFLGGGEPTYEWELLEWATKYIRENQHHENVRIAITTNGTLLTEEQVIWLKKQNVHIGLSFDILEEIQNKQRTYHDNKPTFEKVDTVLALLQKHEVSVRIRATITIESVSLMPEMIEFVHKQYPNIKGIQMEPVQDETMNYETFMPLFVEKFFIAKNLGSKYGIDVYNMLSSSAQSLNNRFCKGEFCVTPNSDIVACQRFSSDADSYFYKFKYGCIKDGKVIIEQDLLKKVTQFENSKMPKCKTCFAKYHCAGMCPSIRLSLSKKNLDTYCTYSQKMVLNELLWQINNRKQ